MRMDIVDDVVFDFSKQLHSRSRLEKTLVDTTKSCDKRK